MKLKVLLTTLNAKYIHKNLALRWLYVASHNKENVRIKEYTIKHDIQKIAEELIQDEADIIAFSVYIWNIKQTMEIVSYIKQKCNKHIILGGPEVTYESFDLLKQGVDAISLGEGEIAFWNYIKMLESNTTYEVEGIYTEAYPNTKIQKVDLKYNESLIDPYFLEMDKQEMSKRYFYFETSRGCPYACEYCLSSTDNQVRMFSEDYVFMILEKISKSDIRVVKLLDRTFNVHPKRALKIARYMNDKCPNQIFQFEIVAETLSEELLEFFEKEADKNRFRFEIGVQSFHSKTLTAVGRIQNNKRLVEVIKRLQKANVVMHLDLIAGLPYEGLELFKHSFNQLYDLHIDEIQLGILKLLKGTKLKAKKEEYHYLYNDNPPYDVEETKWLTRKEMKEIHDCAHAVEKYYNSGKCRYSIDTILEFGLYSDAFSLFFELGKKMNDLKRPYQPHDLFKLLKELIEDNRIDDILKYDYYPIFKQKPKMFLKNTITEETRKELLEMCYDKKIINEEEMYHYTHIDRVYYKHRSGYQLLVYSKKQDYPVRYFIDGKEIEKMEENR